MKQYLAGATVGIVIGVLIGTLFGLSAVAHQLFVGNSAARPEPVAPKPDTTINPALLPPVADDIEFVEGVPLPDPATIPPPKEGDEVIDPND